MMERFLAFSADLVGATQFELLGTGQAKAYLDAVTHVIGDRLLGEVLDAFDRLQNDPEDIRRERLRREILGNEKLGPIARNIIRLWFLGIWAELPRAWTEAFGALENNVGFMVSAAAYTEGLLWPTIGANPPGAKGPGYGSWADPPRSRFLVAAQAAGA
jgi:hypothetical protein